MTVPSAWSATVDQLLALGHQRTLFRNRMVLTLWVVASLTLIVAQQASFLALDRDPDPHYRNVLNLGASYQRYFSFFYYFGGFPVNLDGQKTSTREETIQTLEALGPNLTPANSVYNRASIFLFYPDAYATGRPDTAEMRTGHAIWFTVGLVAVFGSLTFAGMPLLGLAVALLCGSNPFQVWEVYHVSSSTIFPTVISTGLVVTAACILLGTAAFARRRLLSVLVVGLCGVVAALQYEVRLEGVGVFFGAAFALAWCVSHSKSVKLALAIAFAVSAYSTSAVMNQFFAASFDKANAVIASYGGTPGPSGNPYYSTQWWALWSGLGDFDEKYGFLVDDRAGISYYYGHGEGQSLARSHRQSMIATIADDPAWFADIMFKRLKRVLVDNTPYRLGYGGKFIDLPIPPGPITIAGLLLLLANLVLSWRSAPARSPLILFVVPLSIGAVAIGQLADYGLQFYCIAHLFILGYVACFALDGVLALTVRPGSERWQLGPGDLAPTIRPR